MDQLQQLLHEASTFAEFTRRKERLRQAMKPKEINLRKRLRKLKHVPQVTDDKLRRVLKSDREPTPEEDAEIQRLIQQATKEIDELREPDPERL